MTDHSQHNHTGTTPTDDTSVITLEDISELARLIERSSLSRGKKIGYIYLLAQGSFSLMDFDALLKEMEKVGDDLETRRKVQEVKIRSLQDEINSLEAVIPDLAYKAAIEHEKNLEKFSDGMLKAVHSEKIAKKLKS